MTSHPASAPPGSVPAVTAGVLGLVSAAVSAVVGLLVFALGGLTEDAGSAGRWWFLGLVAAAVAQAWGAVRLLRRRGWRLLALGSVPGLLPLVAMIAIWLEYRQDPTLLEVLAGLPLVTLLLLLPPSARRWADTRAVRAPAEDDAMTSSGA